MKASDEMPKSDSERYRRQPKEAQQEAERASPPHRETWLRVAEKWLKLARAADERDKP
jgi:hypothetical protein